MKKRFRLRAGATALVGVLAASLFGAAVPATAAIWEDDEYASISGTVTTPDPDDLRDGRVVVTVYEADLDVIVDFARVQRDGTYTLRGLEPGEYKVEFDAMDMNAVDQWWKGHSSWRTATILKLGVGEQRTGIDATLAKAGSITGRIYASVSGKTNPISSVVIEVWDAAKRNLIARTNPNSDGTYRVIGLTTGSYKLNVIPTGTGAKVTAQWYSNKLDWASATKIGVTTGKATTSTNVTLKTGATLSGKMTGKVKKGVKIFTYRKEAGDWTAGPTAVSNADGTYKVAGLQPGTYALLYSSAKVKKAWKDKPDIFTATTVKITAFKSHTGFNVNMDKAAPLVTPKSATPTISGKAKVGQKLVVKRGSWMQMRFSYRWYANGKAIKGATEQYFKITKAQKGKKITVKVTGKRDGYKTTTRTSKATATVK